MSERPATMFDRFTHLANKVLANTMQQARNLQHDHIATEHIVLGLLTVDPQIGYILRRCGVDPALLQAEIKKRVGTGVSAAKKTLPMTPQVRTVFAKARDEADALQHRHIGTMHLFLGVIDVPGELTMEILEGMGAHVGSLRERAITASNTTIEEGLPVPLQAILGTQSNELVLYDGKGALRLHVSLQDKKDPCITLYDSEGVERAVLRLEADGSPVLELKDKSGHSVFKAP
jgi:hypothetical protein